MFGLKFSILSGIMMLEYRISLTKSDKRVVFKELKLA